MSITRNITLSLLGVVALGGLLGASKLYESNTAGYVQIKQQAVTGDMTVRMEPGMYSQMFAEIHTYKISDVYDFNGGDATINVRFNDAATADIQGQIKYRLPMNPENLLRLHQDFRSYEAVQSDLVRQVVAAALKQSATHFGAEEVYSTRRADFIDLVNDQIKNGLYATTYSELYKKDEDGNNFIKRVVAVKTDAEGNPVISEQSTFDRYNIELIQLVINDIDFDTKTDELIAKRKEAEQEKVVAKAKAERAKQDTITAQEQGKANVALAEAEALVIKKKAVIEAEKAKEVAEQQALQAEEEKKAIISKGEADAQAAKLKVAAGLSPLERAQIDKETAIGVAQAMSNMRFPTTMVLGGDGKGTQVDPFTAVGLESFMRISKSMAVERDAR